MEQGKPGIQQGRGGISSEWNKVSLVYNREGGGGSISSEWNKVNLTHNKRER
jgi:hypothetical protein